MIFGALFYDHEQMENKTTTKKVDFVVLVKERLLDSSFTPCKPKWRPTMKYFLALLGHRESAGYRSSCGYAAAWKERQVNISCL